MDDSSSPSSIEEVRPTIDTQKQSIDSETNDEDGEEEYVVEKILRHEYDVDEGGFKYQVKWDGWDEKTWEPLENLVETQALKLYHKSLGGPPSMPKGSKSSNNSTKEKPSKKRKLQKDSVSHGSDASKSKSIKHNEVSGRRAPLSLSDCWEEEIVQVETLEQDFKAGVVIGFVRWRNGDKSRHTLSTLNKKCPQQMLRFYEAHLQFSRSTSSEAKSSDIKGETPLHREGVTAKDEFGLPPRTETGLT